MRARARPLRPLARAPARDRQRGRRGGRARRCGRRASASRRRRSRPRARTTSARPTASCARASTARSSSAPAAGSRASTPIAGVHHPISVVRMAVEDAYGAKQWREGTEGAPDEVAYRTEKITRSTCRAVAEYAFRTARKMGGKVYGGPKWTVSPVYEGMLKEELDAAAARNPDVPYQPVLIDATYAGLISGAAGHAARHPRAQPRRRLPERPRDADVRLDRRRRVGAAGLRRGLRDAGRDGRGAARHRAGAAGQGRRQPDGDDPGLRRGPALRGRARLRGRRPRLARDLRVRPRGDARPASARPTSAATPTTIELHRARSSRACARRSTSGPRWARACTGRDAAVGAAALDGRCKRRRLGRLQVPLAAPRFRPTPAPSFTNTCSPLPRTPGRPRLMARDRPARRRPGRRLRHARELHHRPRPLVRRR